MVEVEVEVEVVGEPGVERGREEQSNLGREKRIKPLSG